MQGIKDGEEQLVLDNTGLVVSLAKKFCPKNQNDYDEYVQAGRIGLWKAIRKHDSSRGALSTIAWYYIRWEIIRFIESKKKNRLLNFGDLNINVSSFEDRKTRKDSLNEIYPSDLTSKEKAVLEMRSFGYTMKEIGQNFGRSRGWANDKFKSAIIKIKESANER
jgi:RNA polymerase sigma factor (sigma-70 family)|tara:strand:- start:362 stop:853 length:492 start_codon:yes stop_codon:yes gene_type:complete